MKTNTVLKRALSSLMAFTLLITAVIGFTATKASAAEVWPERVISDEYATAEVYSDGTGCITFKDAFANQKALTEIDGVPLKEIIKFGDVGFVDTIYNFETTDNDDGWYKYQICVDGKGPSGFFTTGFLTFVDKTGDTYGLSFWTRLHEIRHVMYNSANPVLDKVYWCTD